MKHVYSGLAALMGAAIVLTSASQAQSTPCEAQLADLAAQQQSIEQQLKEAASITSAEASAKASGQQYEQLMLAQIEIKVQASMLKERCEPTLQQTTAPVIQNGEPSALHTLGAEISVLKSIVVELSAENERLKKLVDKLASQNNPPSTLSQPSPCDKRKKFLTEKHKRLLGLGYAKSHPDLQNIKHQLQAINKQCTAEPAVLNRAGSCVEVLTDLEIQMDKLRSYGYLDSHPDVINITRQLDISRAECSVALGR